MEELQELEAVVTKMLEQAKEHQSSLAKTGIEYAAYNARIKALEDMLGLIQWYYERYSGDIQADAPSIRNESRRFING